MKNSLLLLTAFVTTSAMSQTAVWQDLPNSNSLKVMSLTRPDATATVLIFPGGSWNLGEIDKNSKIPKGDNFLVRSIKDFYDKKLNIVLMGQGSDDLRDVYKRSSNGHINDISNTVSFAKSKGKPVYAVGMSFGAISAVSLLTQNPSAVDGLVLASPTMRKTTKVPAGIEELNLDLSKIKVPVLITGHIKDDCPSSKPEYQNSLKEKFKNSSKVQIKNVSSGTQSTGYKCTAYSWHGFGDAGNEAVDLISQWIKEN